MKLEQYSIGTGDRFGQQGKAQLKSVIKANNTDGVSITPVWNKSHREHEIIGTGPVDVRKEADVSVKELGWEGAYFVDADHITKEIVDPYIDHSDFFTIDVADYIGEKPSEEARSNFLGSNRTYIGTYNIPGISKEFNIEEDFLVNWADQYLLAIEKAKELYDHISEKASDTAVFEISMDEVDAPQTPIELFFILKTVAEFGIPIDTIAPKFTGDFYKGVNYVGDLDQFISEFEQDILVIANAVQEFNLPKNLKLSIHSGSDKFSLYPHMHRLIKEYDAGIHLKTSGTTWLEELIGLVESGSEGEEMVKEIYSQAYPKYKELTDPYATVVDINYEDLPSPDEFDKFSREDIIKKLEHNPEHPLFDSQLRQFLHCSYKIAAQNKDRFLELLKTNSKKVGQRVTDNLYEKHIKPLFLGS